MSKARARVTSKGQLTIPAAVRRALGLSRGDTVTIELRGEGALLRKVPPLDSLFGSVPPVKAEWKSVRRKAWRARAERLAHSSATRTSSSGS